MNQIIVPVVMKNLLYAQMGIEQDVGQNDMVVKISPLSRMNLQNMIVKQKQPYKFKIGGERYQLADIKNQNVMVVTSMS